MTNIAVVIRSKLWNFRVASGNSSYSNRVMVIITTSLISISVTI